MSLSFTSGIRVFTLGHDILKVCILFLIIGAHSYETLNFQSVEILKTSATFKGGLHFTKNKPTNLRFGVLRVKGYSLK